MELSHSDARLFVLEVTKRELSLFQGGLRETLDALSDGDISTRVGADADELQSLLSSLVAQRKSLRHGDGRALGMTDEPSLMSDDQALVFFDWLSRFTEVEAFDILPEHERRVLWDLEASLEETLPQVLAGNYKEALAAAIARITGTGQC